MHPRVDSCRRLVGPKFVFILEPDQACVPRRQCTTALILHYSSGWEPNSKGVGGLAGPERERPWASTCVAMSSHGYGFISLVCRCKAAAVESSSVIRTVLSACAHSYGRERSAPPCSVRCNARNNSSTAFDRPQAPMSRGRQLGSEQDSNPCA